MKTLPLDDEQGPARSTDRHLTLMADVVAAYVSNNSLPLADLPTLMRSVHDSLMGLSVGAAPAPIEEAKPPAVPIKKSITADFLICLEDGKKFRSLKRHLGTVYNLTPEKYREKWGLPSDYPMVAPAYSAVRSQLAKAIGLGQMGRSEGIEEAVGRDDVKPSSAKPEAAKPETAKPETAKSETAKSETAKSETTKPEPAKPEPAKPSAPEDVQTAAAPAKKTRRSKA